MEAGSHVPDIHRNRDRRTVVGRRQRGSPRRPRSRRRVAGHSNARSERTDRPTIGAGERRVVRAETESAIDVARAEVGPSSRARACAVRPGELPRTDRTGAVGISVPVGGAPTVADERAGADRSVSRRYARTARLPGAPMRSDPLVWAGYSSSRCLIPCFETFASVISSGIQSGLSSGAVSSHAHPS